MRVLVQIGYKKAVGTKPRSQKVQAFLNDEELDFSGPGKSLVSRLETSRKGYSWVLREIEMFPDDILRIAVNTFVSGIGPDEACTFEASYYVSEDAPVRDIYYPGVGHKSYPLIKGRLLELFSHSKEDERLEEIEDFLEEGF